MANFVVAVFIERLSFYFPFVILFGHFLQERVNELAFDNTQR